MAKVYMQSIPSDLYSEYRQGVRPARGATTGYQYFVAGYGYAELVGSREPFEVGTRKGTAYPQISLAQEVARCNFSKANVVLSQQPVTGGVTPPATGPRDRSWWFDNMPSGFCFWNNYVIKDTIEYANRHVIPPWAIDPFCYVCDRFNSRVDKWNLNTKQLIAYTYGGPGAGEDLVAPNKCYADENYVYVSDDAQNSIFVFDKDDLSFVDKITGYENPHVSFSDPWDVVVDDNYLYVIDYAGDNFIVMEKGTHNLVEIVSIRVSGDEWSPSARSIAIDYNYVFVGDLFNTVIKKFSRSTRQFIAAHDGEPCESSGFLGPFGMVSDGSSVYVCQAAAFAIYKYPVGFGPGCIKNDDDPVGPLGMGWSGDICLVADAGEGKIMKYFKSDLVLFDSWGTDGTNPGEFLWPTGVCGPVQFYWKDC